MVVQFAYSASACFSACLASAIVAGIEVHCLGCIILDTYELILLVKTVWINSLLAFEGFVILRLMALKSLAYCCIFSFCTSLLNFHRMSWSVSISRIMFQFWA